MKSLPWDVPSPELVSPIIISLRSVSIRGSISKSLLQGLFPQKANLDKRKSQQGIGRMSLSHS